MTPKEFIFLIFSGEILFTDKERKELNKDDSN